MGTNVVDLNVNWDEAKGTPNPVEFISDQGLGKLALVYGYDDDELKTVKDDPVFQESCQQQAKALFSTEEKRLRDQWHRPEGVPARTERRIKLRYTRPASRGWLNREVDLRAE